MQVPAIIFIVLVIAVHLYFQNLSSFVLALFSFPVLLWVLLRKPPAKKTTTRETDRPVSPKKEKQEG